jgi:glycosyltransferase involved in cell wall biosynthesis
MTIVDAPAATEWQAAPPTEPSDLSLPVLSILMPVYNEASTLNMILDRVLALDLGFDFEVIAVDDCSTDTTLEILRSRTDRRLRVLHHEVNRGKGAAVQTALDAAIGDVVVVQDADLEYDPLQLAGLVAPVVAGETDVVYGSRFLGRFDNMRWRNRMANQALSAMTRLLYGATVTDMETCYKVMRRTVVADMRIEAQRFDLEPELTARLLRRGHGIVELPISYQGRSHAEGKKIGWRDGIDAVRTLLRWRFLRRQY